MWGSAPFLDLLRSEVRDRYHLLCSRYGAERVCRPSIALIGALAEQNAPARDADPAAARAAARHAGELYEYLVERWQDPRWREVVTVAIAVGVPGLRGTSASEKERPRRSAGAFYRESGAAVPAGTAPRPSLAGA